MKNSGIIRRVMSMLLSLAVVVTYMPVYSFAEPAAVKGADPAEVSVSSWQELQDAIDASAGDEIIVLAGDIAANGAAYLGVSGKTVTIDLNGKTLDRQLTASDADGHVFWITNNGNLTITDSTASGSSAGSGKITGGYANNGGGINIQEGSVCTIKGGTVTGNKAAKTGGGICARGKLVIDGGAVSDNATTDGGGIYVDSKGSLEIIDGTISGNTANRGGGIVTHAAVTMKDGSITDNSVSPGEHGGGVYVCSDGSFAMDGGAVSDNKAAGDGGAVYTLGSVIISGGSMSGNAANGSGGAIRVGGGSITVSGGTISSNTAKNYGGAAYLSSGASMDLSGGAITDNTGLEGGGGIWVDRDAGSFSISGSPEVRENKADDIFLSSGKTLNVTGAFGTGASVGISLASISGTFTSGFKTNNEGAEPGDVFVPEAGYGVIADANGEARVVASDWAGLQKEIEEAENGDTITLKRNWKASADDDRLRIPAGKTLTIDLNGHTLNRNCSSANADGQVIEVMRNDDGEVSSLTIKDTKGGGKITGGYAVNGGGISINEGCSCTIEGGSVTGNKASETGGGICARGTLTVKGGEITNNSVDGASAEKKGGGIYVDPTGTAVIEDGTVSGNAAYNGGGICSEKEVTLKSGSIEKNSASGNGGGLYIAAGTANLTGGSICSNSAGAKSGGIFFEPGSTLNAEGAPVVTGNSAGAANNILLSEGNVISVTGELKDGDATAKIDITTSVAETALTSGLTEKGLPEGSSFSDIFTYNGGSSDRLKLGTEGALNGELYLEKISADVTVSSWAQLKNEIKSADSSGNTVKTIALGSDVTAGEDEDHVLVEDSRKIVIELDGHTMNRNISSYHPEGHVIELVDHAVLTIKDSTGMGVLTGGYAKKGSGVNIKDNSTLNFESGTIKGNTAKEDGGAIHVYEDGTLNMTGGTITGNKADIGGGIYCVGGAEVSLKNVTVSGNRSDGNGGGIDTHAGISIENCVFSNNSCGTDSGGGIYADVKNGTVTITNTRIENNKANHDGGGIRVENGTVRMNDGTISGCTAGRDGGAVYIDSGKFVMNGGSISKNKGDDCGGVMVTSSTVFEASGVTISGNRSGSHSGGGVNNKGTTGLTDCTLSSNHAEEDGGGIYNRSNLTLTNCSFDSNHAEKSGGALINKDGSTVINGGEMKNDSANEKGGAIYINEGTLDLNGGSDRLTIASNTATMGGDGLWVGSDTNKIRMSGANIIRDNNAIDLYLEEDKIDVTGSLAGSQVGVIFGKDTGIFTNDYRKYNENIEPGEIFIPRTGYSVVLEEEEASIADTEWPGLQSLIDKNASDIGASSIRTLVLQKDWKATKDDDPLVIRSGKAIIIDLNGHTIDRNLSEEKGDGEVLFIEGLLKITDSSDNNGRITGGYGGGGGICVRSGGQLIMDGGTITGNHAGENGAGILAVGTVVINGGVISGNIAAKNAGGIYAEGSVTINGGTIASNRAEANGGGVCMGPAGTLDLNGGEITGNTAVLEGGAVWLGGDAVVNVSGSPSVTGNKGSAGRNILLRSGKQIRVTGELKEGAVIDLAVQGAAQDADTQLTSGLKNGCSKDEAIGIFTYNEGSNDNIAVKDTDDGSGSGSYELFLKAVTADVWVSNWQALQNAINSSANRGKTIGLSCDISADDDDDRLLVEDNNAITIELNGHKLDRALDSSDKDGHVFEIRDDSTLTIKDGAGTGIITGGYANNGGGINIHEGSTLNFEGGNITGNRAKESGGGIMARGTLNMTGGTVAGNEAETGGGIYCTDKVSNVSLRNVTISGNKTESNGGGIDTHGAMYIENCVITGNECDVDSGGGIYADVKGKSVTVKDTKIENNAVGHDGGGIRVERGTVEMIGGSIAGCTAGRDGGGVYVREDAVFKAGANDASEPAEISGNTGNDGGGIYNEGTIDLRDAKIAGNRTSKYGGAGVNNKGTATIADCEISGNSSPAAAGGIYNNGDSFSMTGSVISGNSSAKGGTGFTSYSNATVTDCAFTGNKTETSGGAVCINDCTVTMTGGSMSKNEADVYGGAVYIGDGGTLTLKGGSITENSAAQSCGGILVDSSARSLNIEGQLVVKDNDGGSDIYLPSGKKITISSALTDGASVGVCLQEDVRSAGESSAFTSGYSEKNPEAAPSAYFVSNDDFDVVLKNGEAIMKCKEKDLRPFIPDGSQMVRDYSKLSARNWMAGLSGERYLNEINIPGTHDSGTRSVEGNISTGMISTYSGAGLATSFFLTGLTLAPWTFGVSAVVGTLLGLASGLSVPVIISEAFASNALCQERYIDEQLEDGIRQFDIRLNTYYSEQGYPVNKNDDGHSLWLLHGKNENAGSYFAKDHNDDFLNLEEVLGWMTEFLENHPTETIIMSVQTESVEDHHDEVTARLTQHLRELSKEINPSTGESFLYMEDGTFGKAYSRIPQLKDCRGQIVLIAESSADAQIYGGATGVGMNVSKNYRPDGSYEDMAPAKIKHLTEFYKKYGGRALPTTAGANSHIDYYFSAGTNGTDQSIPPEYTPLDIRDQVFPALFDEGGILLDRDGTYLGLVNMDGVHAKESKLIWKTNFFDGLEYCTVTAKSGDPDDPRTKTYTVLKGTPITIPESIYDAPSDTPYFRNWKADQIPAGRSSDEYLPGEQYEVNGDVTFTAQWSAENVTPVRIEWKDANDSDRLRPAGGLTVKYEIDDSEKSVELTSDSGWSTILDGAAGDVVPQWDLITDGKYTCEVNGAAGSGYVITLTHTPADKLSASGTISWSDHSDKAGIRPESIELQLKAGDEIIKTITVTAANDWKFDFGEYPKYKDGEEIAYTLIESTIDGYTQQISGFSVSNLIVEPAQSSQISGFVKWADDEGLTRPDEVTLRLLKNNEEVEAKTVKENAEGVWEFTFDIEPGSDYADYSITEDAIDGYAATVVNMGGSQADLLYVLNTREGHVHTPAVAADYTQKEATCTEEGKKIIYEACTSCGIVTGATEETIPATGHDWGSWTVNKEATETEEGSESRVCSHDESHVQTRVIPKKEHAHSLVEVPAKDPTCTEDGNIQHWKCSAGEDPCGLTFSDAAGQNWIDPDETVIAATGHDWDDGAVTRKPTVSVPGVRTYTCSKCGATKTEEIPVTEAETFTITYDLNGGSIDGSTADITVKAGNGEIIRLPEAPTRKGYQFLYWKGSKYDPGDRYTVGEDHVFTAEWKKAADADDTDTSGDSSSDSSSDSASGTDDAGSANGVRTGDESLLWVWTLIMAFGIVGLMLLFFKMLRDRKK